MGETSTYYMERGAGEGNRTLVVSLEGFCSTIELHPRGPLYDPLPLCILGGGGWIRTNVGVSQQIYSLPPLATRAPLRRELTIMVVRRPRVKHPRRFFIAPLIPPCRHAMSIASLGAPSVNAL